MTDGNRPSGSDSTGDQQDGGRGDSNDDSRRSAQGKSGKGGKK